MKNYNMTNGDFLAKILKKTTPLPALKPYKNIYNFGVKGVYDKFTIFDLLQKSFPHILAETWREKIENGFILVDGKTCKLNQIVRSGMILQHIIENYCEPEVNNKIELLYDDSDILIVNKPAPLPMHACGRFSQHTLQNLLQLTFPNLSLKIVHRLDAETTGIVILAKNAEIAKKIAIQFENRDIKKTYLALVNGVILEKSFCCKMSIGRNVERSGSRKIDEKSGFASETYFNLLRTNLDKNVSLLEVSPSTGRTNQIRLHLMNLGFPIIGDLHYAEGAEEKPFTQSEDKLCLHAWKIKLTHPKTQRIIEIETKIPNKFKRIGE